MQPLTRLQQLAAPGGPGPSPSFESAHVVLAFLTIGASGTIGRESLAARSGLGGGAVRTILGKLRDEGLVSANASGCHLTDAGKKTYAALAGSVSDPAVLGRTAVTIGKAQVAYAVRGAGRSVKGGIEQRDAAVKVGASGATTLVFKAGRFTIPGGSSDCERDFPGSPWGVLRDRLSPRNGDAVVLCGAAEETLAKLGALAAALTLL